MHALLRSSSIHPIPIYRNLTHFRHNHSKPPMGLDGFRWKLFHRWRRRAFIHFLRQIPIHPGSVWHCVIKLWHRHKKHAWILISMPSTALDCMLFRWNPDSKTCNMIIIKISMWCRKKIDKWYISLQRLITRRCSTRSDCQLFGKTAEQERQEFYKVVNQFNGNLWFLIYSFVIRFSFQSFSSFRTCFIDLTRIKVKCHERA